MDNQDNIIKKELAVLQANSLRDLLTQVNNINSKDGGKPILKEDIVQIIDRDGALFLIYYR
jgi:hypothetical protein